jgi:hypothetical protein
MTFWQDKGSVDEVCYSGSRIRILQFFNPDPGSRILQYIKRGMKNKTNLFLLLMVSGAILISQKDNRKTILKNLTQKYTPWISDSGSKKALDHGTGTLW